MNKDPSHAAFKTHLTLKALPFIICALSSFFYVYEFFLRVVPSVITHELMHEFSMDADTLGIVSAFFYYGYTPMQVPAGILIDRFGPRLLLTLSILLCSVGALTFGLTTHASILSISRFITGFSASFAFIGALVLAARWFPPKYFAFITGLIQMMGCIGAIIGQAPLAVSIQYIGWHQTLIWAGIIGLIATLLFWLIIRDGPKKIDTYAHLDLNKQSKGLWVSFANELKRILYICKNPQTWVTALCGFCCWSPIVTFAALWGVPFLMADYGINSTRASLESSLIWVGVGIASPFVGWWSNAIQSRRIPLITCYLLAVIASIGVIYMPQPPHLLMDILLLCFGVAAASQAITFGIVQDNNPVSVEGTAIGFNNMAVIFGGIVMQPLSGWLLQFCWAGQPVSGIVNYPITCYQKALVLIPLCGLIGLLTALFLLKETHCRPQFASELPTSIVSELADKN